MIMTDQNQDKDRQKEVYLPYKDVYWKQNN